MSFQIDAMSNGAVFRRAGLEARDPMAATVLTIDPGLRVGWSFAAKDPRSMLAGGFFELDREHLFISGWRVMVALLEEYRPSAVVMESYFIGGGAHCGASIEVRGALKAATERACVPWTQVHPSKVRAALGVKGKLSDARIRDIVVDLFQMPAKYQPDPTKRREVFFPADTFDAAAIAWAWEGL